MEDQAPGVPQGLIERTIAVMEAVLAAGEPVGPRGLARATGIDRSAVGRILQQLADIEVLARSGEGYVPGARLFTMARVLMSLDDLPTAANSVLASLVERFDETCYVCVRHGDAAVFLYEAQSSKPLRYVVELGRPVPLHAGGAGRAILAGVGPVEAAELLSGPLEPLTPNTITDRDALLELAAEDRERGFSVSFEERVEGGVAIGAPFFGPNGTCQGSVVFTAPVSRVSGPEADVIGSVVRDAAATLSARLGPG
jgi:DNA-binding IclR family transcriptional regulator